MEDTYRIELLGFASSDRDEAARGLARAFDLDESLARDYLNRAPVTVRSNVQGDTAQRYAQQLLQIGADVRVVNERTGTTAEFKLAELRAAVAKKRAALEAANETSNGLKPTPTTSVESDSTVPGVDDLEKVCPACNHRQLETGCCARCGYKFTSALIARHSGEYPRIVVSEEVDVFGKVRSTAELRALRGAAPMLGRAISGSYLWTQVSSLLTGRGRRLILSLAAVALVVGLLLIAL